MTRTLKMALPLLAGVLAALLWNLNVMKNPVKIDHQVSADRESLRQAILPFHPETPCGAVSLAVATKWLGDSQTTLSLCNQALGESVSGISSANDLESAARSLGYYATTTRSTGSLQGSEKVVLICHVFNSHWVSVVYSNGEALLLDPPHPVTKLDGVLTGWDGVAVVVGRSTADLEHFLTANGVEK